MRMRQGDSEREIARSGLMGRAKAARLRELARERGWLDSSRPLPEEAEIAAALSRPRLPLSAATVDRLRHNAYCLTLDGASYRAPRQGPNRAAFEK